MNLLVDAQLPFRLAETLVLLGHSVVHTSELADGNRTTDAEIIRVANRDRRVVVTKDHDLLDGHLLHGVPERLLLIATGNSRNYELIALVRTVEPLIVDAFERSALVEVSRDAVISH